MSDPGPLGPLVYIFAIDINLNSVLDENAHLIDGKPTNKRKLNVWLAFRLYFFILNPTEHEISRAHKKLKYRQTKKFLALSLSDSVFIMLINVKMPTIDGIYYIYEHDEFRAQLS